VGRKEAEAPFVPGVPDDLDDFVRRETVSAVEQENLRPQRLTRPHRYDPA
jgi:hypothetical protein